MLKRFTAKVLCLLVGCLGHALAWPSGFLGGTSWTGAGWGIADSFAEVLDQVKDVLKRNFVQADSFREELWKLDEDGVRQVAEAAGVKMDSERDGRFFAHVALQDKEVLGYALEDRVHGKWGPISYILSLDPQGRVLDVTVLEYRERRGAPVAKERFLSQFLGKKSGDGLKLQRDIRGVSGATISSRSMTDGIRKLLYVFKHLHPNS